MQGDACMPAEFREVYDEIISKTLKERNKKAHDLIFGKDVVTGKKVELGTTVFADDVAEF